MSSNTVSNPARAWRGRLCNFAAALALIVLAAPAVRAAGADGNRIPDGWEAHAIEPIGFSDLDGRVAGFKMVIKKTADDRWYLFSGHMRVSGWTILDITDPAKPSVVKFVEGPPSTQTSQLTLHGDILMTGLARPFPAVLQNPSPRMSDMQYDDREFSEGLILWDVSDPLNWKRLSDWQTGRNGTHRNSYPGGRYAYLAAESPGYRGYILKILDVSDPTQPKLVSSWAYPGQKESDPKIEYEPGFHGPAQVSPDGKLLTLGYTPSIVNLDISDIAHPRLIGELRLSPPFSYAGTQSLHSVLALWDRNLLFVSSEPMQPGCDREALNFAAFVDISDRSRPRLISIFPRPVPPPGKSYGNFCMKGGRFGVHNVNTEIHNPAVEPPTDLLYMSYFNAGVRIYDIRDAYQPVEVGWFIPPDHPNRTVARKGYPPSGDWAEDIAVDARGNIYMTDNQWGLWVMRYTGKRQPLPNR